MKVTVCIVPKAFPNVRWVKRSLSQATTVGTVKEEFCNCYQISISHCQLCQSEEPSSRQSTVISSDQAVQEVLGKSKDEVTLTAVFQPSIAFHIWHSFDGLAFSLPAGLPAAWQCCVQDIVAHMRSQSTPMSEGGPSFLKVYASIAEAAPTMQLPACSTSEDLPVLLHILSDLLECARDFPAYDLQGQLPSSWIPKFDSQSAEAVPHASTNVNGSQARQMLDKLPLDSSVLHRPGTYPNLSQSVLLVLKLATLTSSIGVQTPNTQSALDVLWNTLRAWSDSMPEYGDTQRDSLYIIARNQPEHHDSKKDRVTGPAADQFMEDGKTSYLIARLAVEEYCKAVTSRPGVADACCKMLTALLQASEEIHYFMVTKEIVCAGGLDALMKAMQTSRATAKPAFELLQSLTCLADPYKHNIPRLEGQMAKRQAVHCCARLLCPPQATETEFVDLAGECFGSDWVVFEDCTKEHLAFLASVATFLSRIAQHPSDEAGRAASRKDSSSSLCFTPTWTAPTKSEWQTIVHTSQLLRLTLAWLHISPSTDAFKQGRDTCMLCLQLEQGLWGILHGLLLGHLQNDDLELGNIGLCILVGAELALGREEMASHQPMGELLRAFLTRLAWDGQLTEETRDEDYERPQSYLLKPLFDLLGVYAKARPKRQSAAHDCSETAFEAMFVFLESEQNITSIRHRDGLPVLDLERCMQHLKGQLAAQMNAGACLCRLAVMELQEADDADTGAELSFDYCDILLTQKGFKAVMEAYEAGIQDRLPWPVEQTVALTRLLWQFSLLLKHVRELEHDLARTPVLSLLLQHEHWSPQRKVLMKLSVKLLRQLPQATMPQMLYRQLLRAVCCSLQVASCPTCTPLDAHKGLGLTLADTMIAATSATQTDSPGVSTDPATSYLDVGLPNSAITAMQAAPLCVLGMMVTEKQQWVDFGSKAFAVAIQTLSHAACVTLAGRAGCRDSAFISEDPPETLCLQDVAPYLSATHDLVRWAEPSDHEMHAATACCMLQLLCLLVHLAADSQVEMATYRARMIECRDKSRALRQAGVPGQDVAVLRNNAVFLSVKELLDDCSASDCSNLVPALDGVLATVRFMQKNTTCAQALCSAAKGQWCKDLGNIPETFAANLSFLEPGGIWSSERLTEVQHVFEVSQHALAKGTRSTEATLAIEAAVEVFSPTVANAASEAPSEAASLPNAEAAAKAAAKRAKKQRQKAKKQQRLGAPQLQQQHQQDALTEGVQQLPRSTQDTCSAASLDGYSSTTSAPATVADSQQSCRDELAAPSEVPAADAAMSVCRLAESAAEAEAMSSCAWHEDPQAPKLHSETRDTVRNDACSTQAQQTSLDSADSPLCALEMHRSQVPNTHMSEASAEGDADQGASQACKQEPPLCGLKHSLDMARLPGRGQRLPACASRGFPSISNLLCCPFTKEPYRDPVIAHDGYTYERTAIKQWLQIKSISPVSGQPLSNMLLTPNRVITAIALDCIAGG